MPSGLPLFSCIRDSDAETEDACRILLGPQACAPGATGQVLATTGAWKPMGSTHSKGESRITLAAMSLEKGQERSKEPNWEALARILVRDKGGLEQVKGVEVVRNKILDTILKVEPTVFVHGLDVGVKQREESRVKTACAESHERVHMLEHSHQWSPRKQGVCSHERG